MTRDLGIVEQQRKILTAMGFKILECENSKLNTDCCGGPIEYAFNELSKKISLKRAKDLKKVSNDIIVFCPICLINLIQFQSQLGIKIWDFGELLYEILDLS